MSGEILEFTKRSLCLKLAGNNKKTTKIKTSPLVKPKSTPKNLSKPEAPDHFTKATNKFNKKAAANDTNYKN